MAADNQRPSVIKHKRTTLERAEKFISDRDFTDVNLRSNLYPSTLTISSITHHGPVERITYDEAIKGEFQSCKVGDSYGPIWSTHWFRLAVNIPCDWLGKEVHLRWDSNSEALLWKNGKTLQGFSGDVEGRNDYVITYCLKENELDQEYYMEMACNGRFGCGDHGIIQPPDQKKTYTLSRAQISTMDRRVYQLLMDIEILIGIVKELPESNRSYQALYTVNQIVNLCRRDRKDYDKALSLAQDFFNVRNGGSQHKLHAMGHCHIDTAWLWPYAETIRKCARSWTNVVKMMERDPEFIFVCSQAQQFEWVKEHYPDLYEEIKHWVKRGQFVPAGASWVEMDGNIPSGESFMRQILYGQKFFMKEFNFRCKELWLPDTFGYSSQIPQILSHMGIKRFLTQKISWNMVNKFPHHTFYWSGIDGSEVLTHFPPGDCYTMEGKVADLVKTMKNNRDKGRCNHSALLYGYGDGGQGPTEEMLLKLRKLKDCDGIPKVEQSTPDEFFTVLENEDDNNYCKWVGELYLELHNGTYTTQAQIKRENRQCEFHLHTAEFLSSVALVQMALQSPDIGREYETCARLLLKAWKGHLLNQFHDVLPGSCIQDVVTDALKYYKDVHHLCREVIESSMLKLFPHKKSSPSTKIAINALSWPRYDVITLPHDEPITAPNAHKKLKVDSTMAEVDAYGNRLILVKTPSYGYSTIESAVRQPSVECKIYKTDNDDIMMENGKMKARIDSVGRVVELYVIRPETGLLTKNLISPESPGNQFVIYDDIPLFWDAWDVMDYHMETRSAIETAIQSASISTITSLRVSVEVSLKVSDCSYIKQTIILDAESPCLKFNTEVEWHESHKFLKVEFPVNVVADKATYEIQFGHLQRLTHYNTSWDQAKFEVCSHKWANLSQYDLGLSLLNDSKYGISTRDNVIRLSLLRASKSPDNKADLGCHNFTFSLLPHTGTFQSSDVIKQAHILNSSLIIRDVNLMTSSLVERSFFSLDNNAVVLDTVKMSEDRPGVLVLRFYESFGSDCDVTVSSSLTLQEARLADGMEELLEDSEDLLSRDGCMKLHLRPFQILTLLVKISSA